MCTSHLQFMPCTYLQYWHGATRSGDDRGFILMHVSKIMGKKCLAMFADENTLLFD
jgi:hypothetical protein